MAQLVYLGHKVDGVLCGVWRPKRITRVLHLSTCVAHGRVMPLKVEDAGEQLPEGELGPERVGEIDDCGGYLKYCKLVVI